VSKLAGGGIGADFDQATDDRGLPGGSAESARRGHPDPGQVDAEFRGFGVEVIKDAAGGRQMQQTPTGEADFHRDAAGGPTVREADGSDGARRHAVARTVQNRNIWRGHWATRPQRQPK
jgi:hypothetical protein